MIPSFNTGFAKVKFRLNQFSIVVQRENYSGAIVRRAVVLGGTSRGAIFRVVVAQGGLLGGNCLEGKSMGGNYPGGNLIRDFVWGQLSRGNCH